MSDTNECMFSMKVEGFLKIMDHNTKEIIVDKKNAIHYENMSEAMADTLSSREYGEMFQMAFGNGGSSVDTTGVITYLPPNVVGQNATLYNQTYAKIIDDTSVFNLDPSRNKMTVFHTTGKNYTDIVLQCLLDYGEPAGQAAFDNSTQTGGDFVFDEMGILANYGTTNDGIPISRLLTHVIFHPVEKALNRQFEIEYTIRISAISNTVTV